MDITLQSGYALLLAAALSVDGFAASFAYGTAQIKIPAVCVALISGICSGVLAVGLFLGNRMSRWISPGPADWICFCVLLGLGLVKLFDSSVKALIRKRNPFSREISFSMCSLHLILRIYADPEQADRDHSRGLSPKEAAALAAALSLDGAAAGFGAGFTIVSPLLAVGMSLVVGGLAIVGGGMLGNGLARRISTDFSWVGGAMLMALAFLKL